MKCWNCKKTILATEEFKEGIDPFTGNYAYRHPECNVKPKKTKAPHKIAEDAAAKKLNKFFSELF